MRSFPSEKHPKGFKLFIGGIPSLLTHHQLKNFFNQHVSSLTKLELPMSKVKNSLSRNKGFAVLYLSEEQEQIALLATKYLIIDDRRLTIRKFLKGKKLQRSRASKKRKIVFLNHVSHSIPLDQLKLKLASKFGKIEDLFRPTDPSKMQKKACALVIFESEDSAGEALRLGEVRFRENRIFIREYDEEERTKTKKKLFRKIRFKAEENSIELGKIFSHCLKPSYRSYFQNKAKAGDQEAQTHQQENLRFNRMHSSRIKFKRM